MSSDYEMRCDVDVKITVNDREGVITRYVEGREQHPYGCQTEEDILLHLAYNATANGVTQANDLDGWADLADDAAVMIANVVEVQPA